ncbi:MAG: hypothetical protein PVI21_01710 [Candidatus Woesebacteria bacterium]|jgi:hypothetical protein
MEIDLTMGIGVLLAGLGIMFWGLGKLLKGLSHLIIADGGNRKGFMGKK